MTTLLGTSDVVLSHWRPNLSETVLEQSIGDALRDAAATWKEETALVEGHQDIERRRRWTFFSLLDHAEQVARSLLGRFSPGEHVAVWAANSPEWMLIEFGAALAGVTLVTVNPAYLDKELTFVLKQSKASGIFVQPTYRQRDLLSIVDQVRSELPQLREVIPLSCWSDFLLSGASQALPPVAPSDVAQIQYTSGTTGFPKGARLTHRNLANNGRFYARTIGTGPGDIRCRCFIPPGAGWSLWAPCRPEAPTCCRPSSIRT